MKRRAWLKIVAVAGSCSLLLLALAALVFPRQVLTVDSGPVRADVLLVLGGGGLERPLRAAELFKAGAAPWVICTGIGDAVDHYAWLTNHGVPATAIQLETRSKTTWENARFTIALLHARHLKSAIIVTTWYHSRRALACFKNCGPGIKFFSRPSYFGYPKDESNFPSMKTYVRLEYLKIMSYWLLYDACPF